MKCPKCGTEFSSKFCPECGMPASEAEQPVNDNQRGNHTLPQTPHQPRHAACLASRKDARQTGRPQMNYQMDNSQWYIGPPKRESGCLKVALFVVLVFVVPCILAIIYGNDEEAYFDIESQPPTATVAKTQAEVTPKPTKEPTPEPEPVNDNMIDVDIDEYHVTYDHYEYSYPTSDAEYITVYYQFTNNSDDNKAFIYAVDAQAFQNGIELESSVLFTTEETRTAGAEIKPGITALVARAYRLQDRSEVELEVAPRITFSSGASDVMTITLE